MPLRKPLRFFRAALRGSGSIPRDAGVYSHHLIHSHPFIQHPQHSNKKTHWGESSRNHPCPLTPILTSGSRLQIPLEHSRSKSRKQEQELEQSKSKSGSWSKSRSKSGSNSKSRSGARDAAEAGAKASAGARARARARPLKSGSRDSNSP